MAEEKHHKHLEHLGELGAADAGAYALIINYISSIICFVHDRLS